MYIYIYIYIYNIEVCKTTEMFVGKKNVFFNLTLDASCFWLIIYMNVPSRLLPQWLHGNSFAWTHDVRLHIAGTNEPEKAQQGKQGA